MVRLIIESDEKLKVKKIGEQLFLDITEMFDLDLSGEKPQIVVVDDTKVAEKQPEKMSAKQYAEKTGQTIETKKKNEPKEEPKQPEAAQPTQATKEPVNVTDFADFNVGDKVKVIVLDKNEMGIEEDIKEFEAEVSEVNNTILSVKNTTPIDGGIFAFDFEISDLGVICEIQKL